MANSQKQKKILALHPGEILKTEFMELMGVSTYALAKALHFPGIYEIVRGERAISADAALRSESISAFPRSAGSTCKTITTFVSPVETALPSELSQGRNRRACCPRPDRVCFRTSLSPRSRACSLCEVLEVKPGRKITKIENSDLVPTSLKTTATN